MIDFLKAFFANERSADEQVLVATTARDILEIKHYEITEGEAEDQDSDVCAPRGCGGCGCR